MRNSWNWKKFLALFMAVAMVMASGVFVTTQSFQATDDQSYVGGEDQNVDSVDIGGPDDADGESDDTGDGSDGVVEEQEVDLAGESEDEITEDGENIDGEITDSENPDAMSADEGSEGSESESGAASDESDGTDASTEGGSASEDGSTSEQEAEKFTLTIRYLDEKENNLEYKNKDDELTKDDYTEELTGGSEYSVESPEIEGYELVDEEQKKVEGTLTASEEIKVFYKKVEEQAEEKKPEEEKKVEKFTLTVKYVDEDGKAIEGEDAHTEELEKDAEYNVKSPSVDGYELADKGQETVTGKIAENTEVTVTYKKTASEDEKKKDEEKTDEEKKSEEEKKDDAKAEEEKKSDEEKTDEEKTETAADEEKKDEESAKKVDDEGYLLDENGERVLDADGNPVKAEEAEAAEEETEAVSRDEEGYLLDENGERVLDADGNPIRVDEEGYIVDENGERILDENGEPIKADAQAGEEMVGEVQEYMAPGEFTGTTASGISVRVSYNDTTFPVGTKMVVADVSKEEALAMAQEVKADANDAVAVDITFVDKDGKEIQPARWVEVSLLTSEVVSGDDVSLIHVPDEGEAKEVKRASVNGNSADFTTSDFCCFVFCGTGDRAQQYDNYFEYSIGPAPQTLMLRSAIANKDGYYLGGTWQIFKWNASEKKNEEMGKDQWGDKLSVAFTSGNDTVVTNSNNKTPSEAEIIATGIANAEPTVVTFTYNVNGKDHRDYYVIDASAAAGCVAHFNANGGSGEVKDLSVTLTGGSGIVQMPAGGELKRNGYTLIGWSLNKDAMTNNRQYGWYDAIYDLDDGNNSTNSDVYVWTPGNAKEITFYAMWAPNSLKDKIGFYIRKDGNIQTEPGSYSASQYITVTPSYREDSPGHYVQDYSMSVDNVCEYITVARTETNIAKVKANVTSRANNEVKQFNEAYHRYTGEWLWDPNTQYIEWYVIKKQGAEWHVDGCIRGNASEDNTALYNLDYYTNCNDYSGQAPVSSQYKAGTEVEVQGNNTLTRSGYNFIGWNTQPDGSGTGYQAGSKITLNENTVLYAQWAANFDTPYAVVCYDAETGQEISRKIGSGQTGTEVEASDADKQLNGYVFDEDNPGNVLKTTIAADGSAVLALYFNPGHHVKISLTNVTKVYDKTATEATVAEVRVDSNPVEFTYDNNTITFTFGGKTYTISSFAIDVEGGKKSVTDSGTYAVTAAGDSYTVMSGNKNTAFTVEVVPGSIGIAKRSVTVTAASLSKDYDGKALTNGSAVVVAEQEGVKIEVQGSIEGDSFLDGDEPKWIFSGSQKAPGHSENTIALDPKVMEKLSANYAITLHNGTLTVNGASGDSGKYQINVRAKDAALTYDGKKHKANKDDFILEGASGQGTSKSLLAKLGDFITKTSTTEFAIGDETFTIKGLAASSEEVSDAGTYTINVTETETLKILDSSNNDVTGEFVVNKVAGTLTINKAHVTLKSKTIEKAYDGTVLENGSEPLEIEEGWAEGQGAKYTFTGKRTAPGSTPNAFTYVLTGGADEKNYEIERLEGNLVVKADASEEITVTPKGYADGADATPENGVFLYDGQPHSVSGFVGEEEDGSVKVTGSNGVVYYVKGAKAEASRTGAGTTSVPVTGDIKVYNEDGEDVTNEVSVKFAEVNLVVNKRKVTLNSATLTKPYDGTVLMNTGNQLVTEAIDGVTIEPNGSVGGDGFAPNEGVTVNFTGRQTIVGESANAFTYELNGNKENYEITPNYGKLIVGSRGAEGSSVGKLAATIVAKSDSTPVYNGQEQKIEGFADSDTQKVNPDGSVTVTVNGLEYTISGVTAVAHGTDAGEYQSEVNKDGLVVKDAKGNDVTSEFEVTVTAGTLKINPVEVTLQSASLTKAYNGRALANPQGQLVVDNAGDGVTVTAQGSETGFIEGQGVTITFTKSLTAVGSESNEFTYKLNEGTDAKNYKINTSFGTLTVTSRSGADVPTIEITPNSGEFPYDGTEHTVEGFVNGDENNKITVEVDGETYYVEGYTSTATGTDANGDGVNTTVTGTPKVTDKDGNDVTSEFNVVPAAGTLKITKRPVTMTSASLSKVYDGNPLVNPEGQLVFESAGEGVNIDAAGTVSSSENEGFVAGQGVSYTFTGSQLAVSESENTFEYAALEGTNLNNYDITPAYGRLKVTSRSGEGGGGAFELVVTAKSEEFTYDGTTHTVKGFEGEDDGKIVVEKDGKKYTITGLTSEKKAKNVSDSGEIEYKGTPKVVDEQNNDVTTEFTVTVVPGTVTVNPRNVTVTTASAEKEYDGTALTANEINVTGDGWADGDAPTFRVTGSQKAPGESDNTFEEIGNKYQNNKDSGNYVIKEELGKLKVSSSDVKYQINVRALDMTATYDGQKHSANKDAFVLEGAASQEGTSSFFTKAADFFTGTSTTNFKVGDETYTIRGLSAIGEGTDAGKYDLIIDGTETITDSSNNDVTKLFVLNKVKGTLTIDKANVTLKSKTLTKIYDGKPLTNGNNEVEATGFVGNEGAKYTFSGSQTAPGTSPNAFKYELTGGAKEENYNITPIVGSLTVTSANAAYEITVTPNGATAANPNGGTFTYDGTKHTVSGFVTPDGKVIANGEPIPVTASNGETYYVSGITAGAALTDAGTTGVTITGDLAVKDAADNVVTTEFKVNYGEAQLIVKPRSVVLTSASLYKEYDGSALENPDAELVTTAADPVKIELNGSVGGDGFVDGEGATYNFTGKQTLVGSSRNTFTYTLNANTKAGNYNISENPGTLTVDNRDAKYDITIPGKDTTPVTYDGQPHTESGFKDETKDDKGNTVIPVQIGGNTYYVSGITTEVTGTDAGDHTGTTSGTPVVKDKDGNDVTEQFNVVPQPIKLKINPADVTLVSADLSKPYDGKPLVNGDTAMAVENGWAQGEGAVYTFTANRLLVGSTPNTYTYVAKEGTKLSNYNIAASYGTLTVTNRDSANLLTLKITAQSGTFEYDGTDKAVSGFEGQREDGSVPVTMEGVTYYVSGLTSTATAKDVTGEAGIKTTIEGTPVIKDSEGHDVSAQFNVDHKAGTLKITPKTLTLVSKDLEKNYDGSALVNGDTPLATEEGWAAGDGAAYSFTGSQRKVGTSKNAFDIVPNSGTKLSNYTINKTEGSLTVNGANAQLELSITANSDEVTYDGQPHTVSGFVGQMEDGRIPAQANGMTFYVSGITSSKTATNVSESGQIDVVGSWKVTDDDDNDVTDQFKVNITKGSLTINKRQITLTSADCEKVYDGYELTNGDNKITVDDPAGLLTWKNFNIDYTGSQTLIGESPNSFEVKGIVATTAATTGMNTGLGLGTVLADGAVSAAESLSNYDIKPVFGTLKVTGSGDGGQIDPSRVITKEHNDKVYKIGDTVDWTISVTNIYNEARTVTLSELPGMTLDQSTFNVAPGATVTTQAHHTVSEADVLAGRIKNHVGVSFSGGSTPGGNEPGGDNPGGNEPGGDNPGGNEPGGDNPGENEPGGDNPGENEPGGGNPTPGPEDFGADDDVESLEKAEPSIAVFKTSDVTSKTKIGDTVTYTITVVNNGNVAVKNIDVADELTGESWKIPSLATGAKEEFVTTYTVTEADVANANVTNVATATGTTDGDGKEVTATGTENASVSQGFTLTIHYVDDKGNPIAGDYIGTYQYQSKFHVDSPEVSGYTPTFKYVESPADGMPAKNMEVSVVYMKNSTLPTDNGNGGNNNGGSNDSNGGNTSGSGNNGGAGGTSSSGGSSSSGSSGSSGGIEGMRERLRTIFGLDNTTGTTALSNTTAADARPVDSSNDTDNSAGINAGVDNDGSTRTSQVRTPAVNNNVVAASGIQSPGAVIKIGDDGMPQLVQADDTETPLAGLGLGDEKCDVIPFICLLLAMIMVIAHTDMMKKKQARIFDLRKQLNQMERK